MKFSNGNVLWAADTLAQNGHPDPVGLVAFMEASDDPKNIAKVDLEDARSFGVPRVDSPVMSMYAALQRDRAENASQYADLSNRGEVQNRIDAAMVAGDSPVNPFVDQRGSLILGESHSGKEKSTTASEETLRQEISKLMDEYR